MLKAALFDIFANHNRISTALDYIEMVTIVYRYLLFFTHSCREITPHFSTTVVGKYSDCKLDRNFDFLLYILKAALFQIFANLNRIPAV